MPNDADSLTETDVDAVPDDEAEPTDLDGDGSVENPDAPAPPTDDPRPASGATTADAASPDPDATSAVAELVTLEDLEGGDAEGLIDPEATSAVDALVMLEDLEGDDADPAVVIAAQEGGVLFDGDPEEFELDLMGSPYPDEGPVPADLMVLDEPMGRAGPPPRRMSRLERRRRVRLQARRVRRIIRHIEPWSVLKISVFFYACLWVIFLVAGFMIWGVAESSGTVDKLENLIRDLFALQTFDFDAGQIFRGYALGGLALAIAGTTFNVLMCLLFNLISDLTGGLRITMIEEETVRPTPPRRRRRRPPSRR